MKNIIGSLFLFFAFVNTSIAITDNREYVDWKDYPNIVKITSSAWEKMAQCTGTEIGKYVITAAHCVEGFDSFTILKNNGTQVSARMRVCGNKERPQDDWAILSLPYETESKYELSENLSGDSGALYGFGALRILTDEELSKVRQYLREHALLDTDELVDLLHKDIPDVGYIYNDGDKLKKSPCSSIRETDKGIQAACFSSSGNSGGGLFINDNKIIGIDSSGNIMEYGSVFAPTEVVKNWIQNLLPELPEENYFKEEIEEKKQIPDFLQNKMACDGKTRLSDAILNNISKSLNKVRDLNEVEPLFEKYYYCTDAAMLMNSCGDLILNGFYVNSKRIRSIEHKNSKYVIVLDGGKNLLFYKCEPYAPKEIKDILLNKSFDSWIYSIDDNKTDFSDALVSLDGGITFYKNENLETNGGYASVFTQKEIAKMPQELKQCLGIIK